MKESRSVQAWRSSRKLINARVRRAVRVLGSHFKRKRTWYSWHHDLESIHHDLELLCSDNDPRCHMRKIKILSLDWIVLIRRLLMLVKRQKKKKKATILLLHIKSAGYFHQKEQYIHYKWNCSSFEANNDALSSPENTLLWCSPVAKSTRLKLHETQTRSKK